MGKDNIFSPVIIQQTGNMGAVDSQKPNHVNGSYVSQIGSNDHSSGRTLGKSLAHQNLTPTQCPHACKLHSILLG